MAIPDLNWVRLFNPICCQQSFVLLQNLNACDYWFCPHLSRVLHKKVYASYNFLKSYNLFRIPKILNDETSSPRSANKGLWTFLLLPSDRWGDWGTEDHLICQRTHNWWKWRQSIKPRILVPESVKCCSLVRTETKDSLIGTKWRSEKTSKWQTVQCDGSKELGKSDQGERKWEKKQSGIPQWRPWVIPLK